MTYQIALLEMRRMLALMEFETAHANRENAMDGWLFDHGAAIREYEAQYLAAKAIVESFKPGDVNTCPHEWYQGACVHCELPAKTWRGAGVMPAKPQ